MYSGAVLDVLFFLPYFLSLSLSLSQTNFPSFLLFHHFRIFLSLLPSFINYYIRIQGTTNGILLHTAPKLHKFAAQVAVGGMQKYHHISPALKELKWLNVKDIIMWCVPWMVQVLGYCTRWDYVCLYRTQNNLLIYTPRPKTVECIA